MMWDKVFRRMKATLQEDAAIQAIYADRLRMASASTIPFDPKTPVLEWTLIGDTEGELWAPMIVQFDQWAATMDVVIRSERALRRLFHAELPIDLGGITMFSQYQDGTILASPSREGFAGRAIRFQFTPLRDRYAELAGTD